MTDFAKARLLALVVPSALMLGALGSQYIGGLHPCEMCYWQRWPHDAAIVLALFAFGTRVNKASHVLVALAALAIMVSGGIGVFHAGVEYGWWEGITTCSTTVQAASGKDVLDAILNAPLIRCDVAPWTLFGISLAGYNFLISCGGALTVFGLLAKGKGA